MAGRFSGVEWFVESRVLTELSRVLLSITLHRSQSFVTFRYFQDRVVRVRHWLFQRIVIAYSGRHCTSPLNSTVISTPLRRQAHSNKKQNRSALRMAQPLPSKENSLFRQVVQAYESKQYKKGGQELRVVDGYRPAAHIS